MKKDIYYLFKNSNFFSILFECIKMLFSGVIGYVIALLINNIWAFVVASVVLVIIIVIYSVLLSKKMHHFDILKILQEEQKKSNWFEIIRIGYPMSRPLWLSGRYMLRVEMGEIIKAAASAIDGGDVKIGNETINGRYILVSTLIDDLGWTRHMLGQTEKAKKSIEEGISIASENGYTALEIKGYRHLFGIYSSENSSEKIQQIEKELNRLIQNLPEDEKAEIQLGLYFSKGEHAYRIGEYDTAIDYTKKAQQGYELIEDYERYVKTLDILGDIYMAQGNLHEAERNYRKGMSEAQKWQRKERYVTIVTDFLKLKIEMISEDIEYTPEESFRDKEAIETLYKETRQLCREIGNIPFEKELKKAYKQLIKTISKKSRRK